MPDTTAKIRAKGLDATGVTEQLADEMYAHKGKHYMAIVEWRVEERHEKADGTKKVDVVLTQVEPATDDTLADHLRELTRTVYYNRQLQSTDGQLQIDTREDLEPKVADVLAAGKALEPHDFTAAPDDDLICDVCGGIESGGVHQVDTDPAGDLEADVAGDSLDPWDDAEPADATQPHVFAGIDDDPATCSVCGKGQRAKVHAKVPAAAFSGATGGDDA